MSEGRTYYDVVREIELIDARNAVLLAAYAMRDMQPDSVRALYAAVDALRELGKQT